MPVVLGNSNLIVKNTSGTSQQFIPTFTDNNPSTHAQVTGSTDRYMVFTTTGANHTFTVPSGGLNCDILMIGGGGVRSPQTQVLVRGRV